MTASVRKHLRTQVRTVRLPALIEAPAKNEAYLVIDNTSEPIDIKFYDKPTCMRIGNTQLEEKLKVFNSSEISILGLQTDPGGTRNS
jgi:hypothetical protein